jgi:hypothetical protein
MKIQNNFNKISFHKLLNFIKIMFFRKFKKQNQVNKKKYFCLKI